MSTAAEHEVRAALRTATAGVVAPPYLVGAVRARARTRQRRQRWVTALAVVLALVVGSMLVALGARGPGRPDITAPPSPPPTAVTVTPGASRLVVGTPALAGRPAPTLRLGWLPPAVAGAADDGTAAAGRAARSLVAAAPFAGSPAGSGLAAFGAADGRGGVVAQFAADPTPHGLAVEAGMSLAVHGAPATFERNAAGTLEYLVWSPRPGVTAAVGVTVPRFTRTDLAAIAAAASYDTAAPPLDQTGNGPATAAVRAAYLTAFTLGSDRALTAVDGGARLDATRAALLRRLPGLARPPAVRIVAVRFTSATHADVDAVVTLAGPGAASVDVPSASSVTWTPAGWQLDRAGWCTAVGRLGGRCP